MKTFQDFEATTDKLEFIKQVINDHKASKEYRLALLADEYDRQLNPTIRDYAKYVYSLKGERIEDFTASNNRIASNFFNRLNTQRVMYSLGNGVSFIQPDEAGQHDEVKERLGADFDHKITEAAYNSCIHGVSFPFWNVDHLHVFKLTEFAPLYDKHTGQLRAGVRFWQLNPQTPLTAVLYTENGYIEYVEDDKKNLVPQTDDFQAYKTTVSYLPADGSETVVGEENYGTLPIVPMWTSRLKQSTLVGMREHIDAYDLIKSGFANDLTDCAEVYWIVSNAGGMTDQDLAKFRDRLKLTHIANVDDTAGAGVTPYTQDIPFQARQAMLTELRNGIYEDFGAFDVHTVAAGSTNDHIDAAYQPMDENASDFEYWVGKCILQILALNGVYDKPMFTRQRISNIREQVETVALEAQWLDQATVLRKLPNITDEEANAILKSEEIGAVQRFGFGVKDESAEGVTPV